MEEAIGVVEAARLQGGVVRCEGLDAHEVVEHEAHRREVRAIVKLGYIRVVALSVGLLHQLPLRLVRVIGLGLGSGLK